MRTAILLSLVTCASVRAAAVYSNNPTVSGVANVDYGVLVENPPGTIVNDPGANVVAALQGTQAAPGGNVELFISSENAVYTGDTTVGSVFASAPRIVLSGTVNGFGYNLSSLNGADWFTTGTNLYDTSLAANTLATRWFNDFFAQELRPAVVASNPLLGGLLDANKATVFNNFRDAGGFAGLSDPNISYLYQDGNRVYFGTAGFLDQSPRLREVFTAAGFGAVAAFIPNGLQYSEVVLFNGQPFYSFNATPSGVQMNDPFESYTGEFAFNVIIPEPGSCSVLAVAFAMFMRRRRVR